MRGEACHGLTFDVEDVRETKGLERRALEHCRLRPGRLGEHYEDSEAMTRSKQLKEGALAQDMSEEEQAEITDDMDKKGYIQ